MTAREPQSVDVPSSVTPADEPPTLNRPVTDRYRWYVVALCFLTFLTASMDRHVFGLLIESIKHSLRLSDSELGLLTGAAFVVFYLLCGIPFGRLLDAKPRPKVLGSAMAIWSLGTVLTGFTSSFAAIFTTRAVVGSGEAAVSPATGSMVADLFHGKSLARPMTIISLGSVLGPGLALALGGAVLAAYKDQETVLLPLLGAVEPWQLVFILIGIPGLLLAPIMFLMRDPPRKRLMQDANGQVVRPSFAQVWAFIATYPRLVIMVIGGFAMLQIASTGVAAWAPSFIARTFQVPTSQAGLTLGAGYILVGVMALFINAPWMDKRLLNGDAAAPLRLARTYALAGALPMVALAFITNMQIASGALFLVLFANTAVMAASVAWARILPNQVRAQVISVHLISTNLIGGMLGPFLIGFATDRWVGDPAKLGQSFAAVCFVALLAAGVMLSLAINPYKAAVHQIDNATRSS